MDRITVYHGSNQSLSVLRAGSWVTDDYEVALSFAKEKTQNSSGTPIVYRLQVDESDVDWDIISMASGIHDERGVFD